MKNKVLSYLGFAKKSGNLITGTGTCMLPAMRKKIKLLIIAEGTADGSVDKVVTMANREGIDYRIYGLPEELSRASGVSLRHIFGITDAGFADVIIKEIDAEKEVLE